ncbi:MAG: hypothetical protein ACOX6U_10980 [Oscillospiraceae bacterium]|jgi:hypothetical protein
MKRILRCTPLVLCVLSSILLLCKIIGFFFGYQFSLYHHEAFLGITAGLFLLLTSALFYIKVSINRANAVFAALVFPLVLINSVFFLSLDWSLTTLFLLIQVGCAIVVYLKFARPIVLKWIAGVVAALLFLLLIFACIMASVFGGLSHNTVVTSITSPQGTYTAEIIDNDQGALGGNTFVEIKNNAEILPFLIGEFSKSSVRIYAGEWNEFETMQLYWQDESTVVIQGKTYDIHT